MPLTPMAQRKFDAKMRVPPIEEQRKSNRKTMLMFEEHSKKNVGYRQSKSRAKQYSNKGCP